MKSEFNLKEIRTVSENLIQKFIYKIILFEGGLGVGKTTLIKDICEIWGVKSFINSPTFSIVNQYSTFKLDVIYHIDLYRINSVTEIFDSGIEEYFDNGSYCLVENPGNIDEIISNSFHRIKISKKNNGNRVIELMH